MTFVDLSRGSMAFQNADNVTISGGTIGGANIASGVVRQLGPVGGYQYGYQRNGFLADDPGAAGGIGGFGSYYIWQIAGVDRFASVLDPANLDWSLQRKNGATVLQFPFYVRGTDGRTSITANEIALRGNTAFTGSAAQMVPAAKAHFDNGTNLAVFSKYTAGATTGQTAADGFDIGILGTGEAEIRQRENLPIRFYTNNTLAVSIAASGGSTFGVNGNRAISATLGASKPITIGTASDTITVTNCFAGDVAFVAATDNTLPVQTVIVATNGSVPFNSTGYNGKTAIAHVIRFT